jgi:hypothetical protein
MPQMPLAFYSAVCWNVRMRQFLSANAFAKIIQKDPKTVIRWIEQGWIASAKRVGHRYQTPMDEVEVFNNTDTYPPRKEECP